MSTMIDGDTWHDTIVINKQSGTVVNIATGEKYVDKPIALTLNVQPGSVSIPDVSVTANPIISFDSSTGDVTANVSASENIGGTVSAGFVSGSSVSGTANVSGSSTYTLPIATIAETKAYLGIL